MEPQTKNPFAKKKKHLPNLHFWGFHVNFQVGTLLGINISHLGKRKIIFKMPFLGDMLVPWRVTPEKLPQNQATLTDGLQGSFGFGAGLQVGVFWFPFDGAIVMRITVVVCL